MPDSSPSVAFTRHVLSAWSRWSQRLARSGAQATLLPAELQAQYELLAAGVAATLSDDLVQLIWRDEQEADGETIWTLLLPLQERVEDDRERVHFLLVVVAELMALGGDALTQGNGVRGTARALWLVETLVMPLVKSNAYARLHPIALVLVERLVRISSDRVATLLSQRVYDALVAESDASEADDSAANTISYVSLCRVFQIVLQSTEAFVRVAELNEQIKGVCAHAIEKFDRQPRYLRAVSVHLMPALVASAPRTIEELVETAIATWETSASVVAVAAQGVKMRSSSRPAQGSYVGSQVSNLMYMLCLLLPKDPTLMRKEGLQQLIAFALTHDDPLLRKQALHLLKISFSHYAVEATSTTSGEPKSGGANRDLEIWQSFILASDVIQLHHEPHLLEQVWPQVEHLLQLLLIVPRREISTNDVSQLRHSSSSSLSRSSSTSSVAPTWPVKFTFSWIQSLLMRVFRHENPIVRRMFLSNFMEACVKQLTRSEWALGKLNADLVDTSSFICDPQFEVFVFQHVLQACNDPLMYKSSRREPFQAVITQFLALYLAFKVVVTPRKSTPVSRGLLNSFVCSACDAVFGPGSVVHSPEAIVSSLQVFGDESLQRTVAAHANSIDVLDETSFEKMRFILEVYVLRSFPLSMRTKLLQSLQQALTAGFARCKSISLDCVARTVAIFPPSHLTLFNGAALLDLHQWLSSTDSFRASLPDRAKLYLVSGAADLSPSAMSAKQLARLLLFTAHVESSATAKSLVLQRPVSDLVGDVSLFDPAKLERLLILLGSLEIELGELQADVFTGLGLSPHPAAVAPIVFRPKSFYGAHGLSCQELFRIALRRAQCWLAGIGNGQIQSDHFDDDEMLYEQDLLTSCAVLAVQLATFAMEEDGDISLIHELSNFCKRIIGFISSVVTKQLVVEGGKKELQDQALALRFLSIQSSQHLAHDAIDALECESVLTMLLRLEANRQGTNSSRYLSDCIFMFVSSKWRIIRNVIEASAYVPTVLLKEVLDKAVEALFSTGTDPQMLTDMVTVMSTALSRLGSLVIHGEANGGEERLNEIFNEIWTAYGHAKPKPDSLTRAVIFCIFQPAFMRCRELIEGDSPLMMRWFRTIVGFGEVYRPNVLFHLGCRVVQIWRVEPRAALPFAAEIVELLLYREPIIADKQKSPTIPDVYNKEALSNVYAPSEESLVGRGKKSALSARDRFVRFIILSFLDEMSIDDHSKTSDERQLLDIVLSKLLEMNFGDDAQKQQMLNSDGFGRRLRSWQAMTVLSKHITSSNVATLSDSIWRAFAMTQLPMVRFYMEVLGMRLAMRFPEVTLDRHILPLLRNYNLTPQVGASVLLISGFFINHTMLGSSSEGIQEKTNQQFARSLLEALLPWLNASHGHTRVMVQFLLGVLLPRHLHVLESTGSSNSEITFFQGIARFLSENKETKRMFRRQAKQFDTFQPDFQCTMFGMLTTAGLNEFNELFPDEDSVSLSAQLKETMNVLYEQFQREHFATEQAVKQAKAAAPPKSGGSDSDDSSVVNSAINVQRKIDTSAILLDESVLPVAMRDRDELVEVNIRQKRRQEVILCASLVDKIPNLAGLARTCEIFNAQKLIVPNIRVCDDEVFQTISVTANKWIPMEEVKEEGLVEALKRWKGDGYTIVAVEQTASSQCLSRFEFPEKIVIVLGKEKEGIPVDVLQMVDVCVEIPQFGLIRSLNVHVSGAILLWEYTQQRLTRGN